MNDRLRVGVVGTGVIAQVMHLHFLRELADRYEVVALCDVSAVSADACATDYNVPEVFTDWREMLRRPLDAVFILTSGSHAPLAIAAARAGRHVFAEKPMCFSAAEGVEMIEAAKDTGVTLMVGYPKRYDGAFRRFQVEVDQLEEKRLLRVTTTESPFLPYVRHYGLHPPANDVDKEVLAALRADSEARLREALGTDDEFLLNQYQAVLLDTLVHEINTVRAVLGEPASLDYAELRPGQATVLLGYGPTQAAIHWVDTPNMTRYSMEFALLAAGGRVTLTFPSPYLRNAPASLVIEGGSADSTTSWRREEITDYESGFKEELRVFYDAVTAGGPVPTDGVDGVRDVALCQAIIRCAHTRQPVERPTDF
jgi:predicted dehydrogenase